ncbi:MAG: murein hydrolase activator EnvC [Candidatus Melainabacteria bacterium]
MHGSFFSRLTDLLTRYGRRNGLWQRLTAVFLLMPLLLGIYGGLGGLVRAEDVNDFHSKRKSLESQAREIRRKKQEKLRQAEKYSRSYWQNQRQLESKRRSLNFHQRRLSDTKYTLESLQRRLDEVVGERSRLTDQVGLRVRKLYEGERLSVLSMVLEANDMATLLDRLYYKQKIVAADKAMLNKLKGKIGEFNQLKGQLAEQKDMLSRSIQTIRVQEQQFKQAAAMDASLRDKYRNDAQFYARAEQQLLEESARIAREIQAMTSKNPKQTISQSTGMFDWPIRGPVTSRFGYRVHPIHRTRKFHTGLDIGGPNGGAIRAADGGQVIFAGWKGGYGKAVMINHGYRNGRNFVTLYGHMSGFAVSNGATVSKGQTVGYEGSTGYATGPHLHFEIRENGNPVDPYRYLH